MFGLYNCTIDNNPCEMQETCMRYLDTEEPRVTLYKNACNEDNDYLLYIRKDDENEQVSDGEEGNN